MPLPLLSRKYQLLAKIEGAYGVDSAPTAAANAVLAENLKFKPSLQVIDRKNVVLPDLSKLPHLVGKISGDLSFDVELRGSGDADGDVPPDYGCLLRACSMSEAITGGPGGNVTYAPESDTQESVTIYCFLDGQLQKFVGCMGTWKLAGKVGEPAKFSFTFKGKWNASIDQVISAPTYQNLTPPLCLGATFAYGGWSPPISKFDLDLKNDVKEREDIQEDTGIKGFFVVDRAPEGSIDPEASLLAVRDVWANLIAVNEAALSIALGSTPGNECAISAPKCAKTGVDWADRGGLATYDIKFGLYRTSGNDEISLVFT
jgi:hypothetical protein